MSGEKRKLLRKKGVKLHQDLFGRPTWPPFIVLRHQYGRRGVMFKYLAPARERDFKYLLFETPPPALRPIKARFKLPC